MFYKVNRLSRGHELLRKGAYSVLFRLPDNLKYGAGDIWRQFRRPYSLIREGDTVVQVGAPWDTLKAGRSRAAYFSRIVGDSGTVVALEPDPENVKALKSFADRHSLVQLSIVETALWSEPARLRFLADPEHPAANLVEAVLAEGRDPIGMNVSEVDANTLDNFVRQIGCEKIRLLSVTTNGSELQILQGATETLKKVEWVSVITEDAGDILADQGFAAAGEDDRGYLFHRR